MLLIWLVRLLWTLILIPSAYILIQLSITVYQIYVLKKLMDAYQIQTGKYLLFVVNLKGFVAKKIYAPFLSDRLIHINNNKLLTEKINDYYDKVNDKDHTIDIILHTHGGNIESSDAMIQTILSFRKKGIVNIHIPIYAYSAGTLLALSGTNLFMNSLSVLSPTDPQITVNGYTYSSEILAKILENKQKNITISETTYLQVLDTKKLHNDNIVTMRKLLSLNNVSSANIKKIINEFASGKIPHHKPFDVNKIKSLGINISGHVPENISKMFYMYLRLVS